MSVKTSGVKIHYTKDNNTFDRSFSGFDITNIADKNDADTKFVGRYSAIVDGTPETVDFIVTEKGIEVD